MVAYKIVKFCFNCKKRFTVKNGQSFVRYCDLCKEKVDIQ